MRVHFKFALICLIGLAALSGMHSQAAAGAANLSPSGLFPSAHVSSLLQPVYHHSVPGEHADRCYIRHLECRYSSGFGHHYRRCMAHAGCGYRKRYGYGRKYYGCRYWLRRCRENWYYPEDIHGCLRYHGCQHNHY